VQDPVLKELLAEEERLGETARAEALAASGLKDLDGELAIVEVKLRIALRLMEAPDPQHELIRDRALAAARRLEELQAENISEDQRGLLTSAPGYARIRELFQIFVLRGGGGYLEVEEPGSRNARIVARAVVDSIRKYLNDRYDPSFRTEDLPPTLRKLANIFLPILAPEGEEPPPYDIEEGQELTYTSQKMRLPLSQAVLYLERELIPELERTLEQDPGNHEVQRELRSARERLFAYRNLRFAPRSTPINIEKNFYTEWWSEFSSDGELLVSVPLAVSFRSGTNLDRLRDLVQSDVVRRLAGRKVCPALDREYRYRRSLESGRSGSSRVPSFKLDTRRGFSELKNLYPAMKRIENRQQFAALVDLVRSRGQLTAVNTFLSWMREEKPEPPLLT
jgi:hypothetical protein